MHILNEKELFFKKNCYCEMKNLLLKLLIKIQRCNMDFSIRNFTQKHWDFCLEGNRPACSKYWPVLSISSFPT